MIDQDSSALAHPSTRELRGLALYRAHADEIERIAPHTYSVPSCTGETTYTVRLDRERCDCPDFDRHHAPCKHVYAAAVAAAVAAAKAKARRRGA